MNNCFFQKKKSFLKFEITYETIQSIEYDNYDDFQHINIIISQNFISLFLGLLNDETDLRVSI
jgi:hypothetical protein